VTTLQRASTLVTFVLAACGGSSLPNGSVVNSPGGPGQPPTKLVPVKVTITIPARAQNIRPGYVSVKTQSLVIQLSSVNGQGVTGANPTTINTVAHARGCATQAEQLVCAATASGSPGDDIFAVTTYDNTNANGAVLSVGNIQAKIGSKSDVQINNLSLTLGGVIAALKLAVSPKDAKRGKPATADVVLRAFDASGAEIVGPSDFAASVALTIQGDISHAFLLHAAGASGSSLSLVKPTTNITLSYNGNAQASSITIAAVVTGLGSVGASTTFALHGKTPPPPVGTIYALNLGANGGQSASVTEYDGKAKGNAAPERTLSLSPSLYARTIAVDSVGNLYVGYLDNSVGYNTQNGAPDTGNEVAIYAPGASGNAPPKAVLTADSTTNTALFPVFINFDPSGRLVTYGGTSVDGNTGDAVLTYAAGSSGPATPQYGFDFAPTIDYAGALPTGLAIDSANDFYVNGGLHTILGNQYGLYVASAADIGNPVTAPARTIPWDPTTQLQPGSTTNVGLDQSAEIFIGAWVNEGTGNAPCQALVNVYAAGANGGTTDAPPLRVLTLGDVSTKGNYCYSSRSPLTAYFPTIALYATSLFVVDDFNNAIDEFTASGHGSVNPSLRIVGPATQLNAPVALAITSLSGPAKAAPVTGTSRLPVRTSFANP
jgi:hypothetical protein